MPILSVEADAAALTLTLVSEHAVSVARLWAAWADPRQLERFWGPPCWPATFSRHALEVGARSQYCMTGPEGQTVHGYWVVERVDPPQAFAILDGFATADGAPDETQPTCRTAVRFEAIDGGARQIIETRFPSVEAMERLTAMGMADGLRAALGQMDAVLADLRDFSASWPAELRVLDATRLQVTRVVRGTLPQVWRAHREAALLQRWLLGPPGWTMPVCEVATQVGDAFRYEWESEADGTRFGFVGELIEAEPPRRAVTTERPIGVDGPPNINTLVLTPRPGGRTQIEVTITCPSQAVRDLLLATDMVVGMEAGYVRLEGLLAA